MIKRIACWVLHRRWWARVWTCESDARWYLNPRMTTPPGSPWKPTGMMICQLCNREWSA